jgi:hypothetical protein
MNGIKDWWFDVAVRWIGFAVTVMLSVTVARLIWALGSLAVGYIGGCS